MRRIISYMVSAGVLALSAAAAQSASAEEVNVYSYRQPQLIEPILERFTAETGIKANVIFAKKGLIERIETEGANSPADVLLTVDISRLDAAKEKGITQPVASSTLSANIPAQYRDSEGHWFGLTTRARIIYASKDRVAQDSITYEELSDPKWKGRLCTRSGQHVYTIGLISSMLAHKGEAETQKWLEGVRDNLARKPTGNDRGQVEAVFSGECDISLGNTYYMGRMQTNEKKPEQKDWAKSVRIIFPNTGDRGTHVNLSGAVLAKHAPNKVAGVKLMEFLSGNIAQELYAEANFEYPVKDGVKTSDRVASWGSFKADEISLNDVAAQREKASELVDIVGFNNGPNS